MLALGLSLTLLSSPSSNPSADANRPQSSVKLLSLSSAVKNFDYGPFRLISAMNLVLNGLGYPRSVGKGVMTSLQTCWAPAVVSHGCQLLQIGFMYRFIRYHHLSLEVIVVVQRMNPINEADWQQLAAVANDCSTALARIVWNELFTNSFMIWLSCIAY